MRLTLFAVLFLPVLGCTLLAGFASYHVLRTAYTGLLGDRLQVLANGIADFVGTGGPAGQPIASAEALQFRLDREKARDDDISGISAVLGSDLVVLATDRSTIGTRVPAAWLPPGGPDSGGWVRVVDGGLVVGAPVPDPSPGHPSSGNPAPGGPSRPVGAVVLAVSGTRLSVRVAEAYGTVVVAALIFLLFAAVLAFLVASQTAARMAASLRLVRQDIDAAADLVRAETVPPPQEPEPMLVARARALVAPAAAAEQALQRIDS